MRVLIVHRPGSMMGGDMIAAIAYCEALNRLNVDAQLVAADRMGDLSSFDWVHLWSANAPQWGYPAAVAANSQGVKLSITPNWWSRDKRLDYYGYHEQDVVPGYTQAVARTLALADVLFVCAMGEAVQCWQLTPFKDVYWFGHGCDVEREREEAEDYVVCLARIEPHKNQVNLAMACRANGMPLKLVGSPADGAYAAKCEALGAEIISGITRDEALDILARARVHALPSFSETPGMSNMEACKLGVPAVMGNIGAEPEFFGHGGIYVDPRNWRQIATAVQIAWHRPRQPWAVIPCWEEVAMRGKQYMEQIL